MHGHACIGLVNKVTRNKMQLHALILFDAKIQITKEHPKKQQKYLVFHLHVSSFPVLFFYLITVSPDYAPIFAFDMMSSRFLLLLYHGD